MTNVWYVKNILGNCDGTRVGRYLKNQLTIIVMEKIAIIDNIAINEIEKNYHCFQVQLISKHV